MVGHLQMFCALVVFRRIYGPKNYIQEIIKQTQTHIHRNLQTQPAGFVKKQPKVYSLRRNYQDPEYIGYIQLFQEYKEIGTKLAANRGWPLAYNENEEDPFGFHGKSGWPWLQTVHNSGQEQDEPSDPFCTSCGLLSGCRQFKVFLTLHILF